MVHETMLHTPPTEERVREKNNEKRKIGVPYASGSKGARKKKARKALSVSSP